MEYLDLVHCLTSYYLIYVTFDIFILHTFKVLKNVVFSSIKYKFFRLRENESKYNNTSTVRSIITPNPCYTTVLL